MLSLAGELFVRVWQTGVVEPGVVKAAPGTRYQFERLGYFCVDTESTPGKPVFNRTVTLWDTWAKIEKAQKADRTGPTRTSDRSGA